MTAAVYRCAVENTGADGGLHSKKTECVRALKACIDQCKVGRRMGAFQR